MRYIIIPIAFMSLVALLVAFSSLAFVFWSLVIGSIFA